MPDACESCGLQDHCCSLCGCCRDCCECSSGGLFDSDELGEDPEEDVDASA